MLISDIITASGTDSESSVAIVLPTLVQKVGDTKVLVRKAALHTLVTHIKCSSDATAVIEQVLSVGLQHDDVRNLPSIYIPSTAAVDAVDAQRHFVVGRRYRHLT